MDIALISIFLGYYTIIKIIGIPWPLLASKAIETIAMSNLNLASEVTRGQRPVGVVQILTDKIAKKVTFSS